MFCFLKGYKVFYTTDTDLPIILWNSVEIANQERMATINGLTPNRTYTISVLAYSEMGQGPLSVPSQVITRQGGMYQLLFFVSITEFSGVSFSQGFFSSLKSSQEFCIFSLSYLELQYFVT